MREKQQQKLCTRYGAPQNTPTWQLPVQRFQEATSETVKRKSTLTHSLSGQVGTITKQKNNFTVLRRNTVTRSFSLEIKRGLFITFCLFFPNPTLFSFVFLSRVVGPLIKVGEL